MSLENVAQMLSMLDEENIDTPKKLETLIMLKGLGIDTPEKLQAIIQKNASLEERVIQLNWTNGRLKQLVKKRIVRTEKDGIISFTLPATDGMTGREWCGRLALRGVDVEHHAKYLLMNDKFKPTAGVVYKIVIMRGKLFKDDDRTMKNICAKGDLMKLIKPHPEVACIIRESFLNEEMEAMGLSNIVVMNDPIDTYGEGPWRLMSCLSWGEPILNVFHDLGYKLGANEGFAFVEKITVLS